MKKQLHLIGIIGAVILFIGVIFKSNHFPGAAILLLLGALTGAIYMALFLTKINILQSGMEKSSVLTGAISMIIVLIGFTFKIQHWPGASAFLLLGHIMLVITGIMLLIDAYKEPNEQKQSIKAFSSFTIFILMTILLFLAFATGAIPML